MLKFESSHYIFRLLITLLIVLLLSPCKLAASLTFPVTAQLIPSTISQPIYVTHLGDGGTGSLRWAIARANETPEDDLIDLSRVNGTIMLCSSLPTIASNLFIVGDGNDTINGNHAHRVLSVKQGEVAVHNLTIRDGLAQGSDGQNGAGGSAGMGGGLWIEDGTVILSTVTFVENQAIGGNGTQRPNVIQPLIDSSKNALKVNRGAVIGINGVGLTELSPPS